MKRFMLVGIVGLLMLPACAGIAGGLSDLVKWSQAPDMNRGCGYSSEEKIPSIVADDWISTDERPVVEIRWWGAYWARSQGYNYYSDLLPNAQSGGITGFRLQIWGNLPADQEVLFNRPGELLWSYETDVYTEVLYGVTQLGRTVYQYQVLLDEEDWFSQEKGTTYWLSIEAYLPEEDIQWGWHESSEYWNAPAVQMYEDSDWYALITRTDDVNMAYQLAVVPEPGSLAVLGFGFFGLAAWRARLRPRNR